MSSRGEPPPTQEPVNSDDAHLRLSRQTTPTWEIELLISGVAVFATLGLPGWLDDARFVLEPRLAAAWARPLELAYYYAKVAALILCVTFIVHLVLRAHWIALVGLHSVYPDWIRWERLKAGPVQRQLRQARDGGAESVIERADNRATVVFALGSLLFANVLSVALILLILLSVRALLVAAVGFPLSLVPSLLAGLLLLTLPLIVADRVDRRLGDRMSSGGRLRWLLERVFAVYGVVGLGRGANQLMAVLMSHVGRMRFSVLVAGLVAGLMLAAPCSYHARREPHRLGSYELFPPSSPGDPRALDSAHYDDSRDPVTDPPVPFIQSAIVPGPYLRLVVPFDPDRDGAALRSSCPTAGAGAPGARRLALLDCLQRLRPLRLDGRSLPIAYELASDPRTDRPALAAMIDVRALAPGRHELAVARAIVGTGVTDDDRPHTIAFWR